MRAPIHSLKHYIQVTLSTATTASVNIETIAKAVERTIANVATEVAEGAIVKAVYIELWVIGSVSNQFFTITVEKIISSGSSPNIGNMADLNGYSNKKNILYTTQGLASNDGIAMPVPVIRQWFKIPKGKQRFGLGDKLLLSVASRGSDDIIYCGFATYKEYT